MIWGLHHQWDCLVQEVEKAEKEWEQIINWVGDLLDQRADVRYEISRMKQESKQLKAEKERLEVSGLSHRSGHAGPVVPSSAPGQPSMSASSAESMTFNKEKSKQKPKRHPGLPLEERLEYYNSYLAHI